jgi:hypothetical protein
MKKKEYQCCKCKTKYYKIKTFNIFSIHVNNVNNNNATINDNKKKALKRNDSKFTSGIDEYSHFDFINYFDINEKEKEYKHYNCKKCNGNKFVKKKKIYSYCPEILILSFDINDVGENDKQSFFIDLVDLDLNDYIEDKQQDVNFKYKLNSFVKYDWVKNKYITYLKNQNSWINYDEDLSKTIDCDFFKGINNPKILFYIRE